MEKNTRPITLGDTVHIRSDAAKYMWHRDELAGYSGIVISISPQYIREDLDYRVIKRKDIKGKIISFYNFEDKKMMTLDGVYFEEWDEEIEKQSNDFGNVDCIKRVGVGETVHSSQDFVYTQHGATFIGVVTNVSPTEDGLNNILTINGAKVINEYWTQEYQDNILASESAIRSIKNGGTKK